MKSAPVLSCLLCLAASAAWGQSYPSRPITLIVPFAAGGPADGISRAASHAMSKAIGQTVIVDNVGGAGGTIGATRAAKANPDGYTILYHNLGMVLAPSLVANLEFDPVKDFDYIGIFARTFSSLIARPDMPVKTFQEFVAYVKERNEKIMFANSGLGGISHVCALRIADALGTRFTSVPYKGTGPAMNDLMAGRVDLMCDAPATSGPRIRAGKVKSIGVMGLLRSRVLPDVPTLDEQGLKGFEMENWNGLYAPRGLPAPVLKRLTDALESAFSDPDFDAYLRKSGYEDVPPEMRSAAAQRVRVRQEVDRWSRILKQAGIKPQ